MPRQECNRRKALTAQLAGLGCLQLNLMGDAIAQGNIQKQSTDTLRDIIVRDFQRNQCEHLLLLDP